MAAAAVCERVAAGVAATRSHLGEFASSAAPARNRAVAHRRDCRPAGPAPLRWESAAPCGRREAETRAWQQRWRARSASSKVPSVGEGEFEAEVLQSPVPVLVDFWATWCGPCKLMGLSVDWAAKQYEGKLKCVKIDLDANKTLGETYNVYGLPTIILFADGKEVPNTKREGALGMDKLQAYLEQKLPALAPTT